MESLRRDVATQRWRDRSGARWLNRTKPSLIVALLSIAAFGSAPAQATPKVCPADLNTQVEAILDRPVFRRMRWGVLVQTQRTGNQHTLVAHDADRYFVPASNAKLLTTAAVLEKLGSQFRIRTSVYQVGDSPSGAILQVVGRGDPSLTDADLERLAGQIRSRGMTQIDRLVGDDRFFGGDLINPSWEWEDVQAGYGAPASSFILNQNRIGLSLAPQAIGRPLRIVWDNAAEQNGWRVENRSQTVAAGAPESLEVGRDLGQNILYVRGQLAIGSNPEPVAVSIPQPAPYFLAHLQQALAAVQLPTPHASLTPIAVNPQTLEVAAVESPPLTTLITVANQQSNNLYAESLLRHLQGTTPTDDALAAGLANLEPTLTRLGVDPATYHLVDGSGLSRRNLVSPSAIVQTLQGMSRSPNADAYRASLSVAGVSGTLRNSFRDTPIQGRLQGKTGSMTDITSLSGYFQPPNYSPLVFSILINQAGEAIDPATGAIDEILLLLARLEDC